MPDIARIVAGSVISSTPVISEVIQSAPRTKVYYDIRTDATLSSEISISYAARPVIDFGPVNGLPSPAFTGEIPIEAMNKVVELNFDAPITLITWTYSSSAGKKLYLAQFTLADGDTISKPRQ